MRLHEAAYMPFRCYQYFSSSDSWLLTYVNFTIRFLMTKNISLNKDRMGHLQRRRRHY